MKILAKGIDVSSWQGNIDWDKVKADGIQFAILRCGYGSDMTSQDDKYFARNVKECERVGMPFGLYIYSYADSLEKAKSEAAHTLRLLKGLKPQYPIYYDLEDAKTTGQCSKDLILEMAKIFVETLEKEGYWVGIYANKYWNTSYLTDKWYDSKARWIAQYHTECTYKGDYGIWQYSSSGKVNGIKGNVDMNYAYIDYPTLIKNSGKNGFVAVSAPKPITNPTPAKKTNEQIAEEVLDGLWGNGTERKNKLTAAGYDYNAIQTIVNSKAKKNNLKSTDEIVREVIRGLWGNGQDRVKKLKAAGYNPKVIQDIVNELV